MADYRFDTSHLEWREVKGELELSYKLRYDYSILGWDRENGTIAHRMRPAGEYGRSSGPEELPHMERGGADGALILYGCHAPDGRLFEFLDDDLNVITEVTIENMIEAWELG